MNKTELINRVAAASDLSRQSTGIAINNMIEVITNALIEGESVGISGFGTFRTIQRGARTGYNIHAQTSVPIPASIQPDFKPSPQLKEALRNRYQENVSE